MSNKRNRRRGERYVKYGHPDGRVGDVGNVALSDAESAAFEQLLDMAASDMAHLRTHPECGTLPLEIEIPEYATDDEQLAVRRIGFELARSLERVAKALEAL